MRTTVDFPDDLHQQVAAIARDRARSFSETAVELMLRGLQQRAPVAPATSPRTHLPLLHLRRVITTADVRALQDE